MSTPKQKFHWKLILPEAKRLAGSFTTAVTLRQLHYLLVSSGIGGYTNTQSAYKGLSRETSKLRRLGLFPPLSDFGRAVWQPLSFASTAEALVWLAETYQRDHTEGQVHQVWFIFEKMTLQAQMQEWTDPYGLPIAALRGYSSETLDREVCDRITDDGRPVVGFYVGDLDPEGEDIERNFLAQAQSQGVKFKRWTRLGVTPAQVTRFGLVENPGKPKSSRAPKFIAKYGRLFQIEIEALDPAVVEALVTASIKRWLDQVVLDRSLAREAKDIKHLEALARV